MANNNEQDLSKIREEYESLYKELLPVWAEYNRLKDILKGIEDQISELDKQKKTYMVRLYKETYTDIEVDAFNDQDAVSEALKHTDDYDPDDYMHFASSTPRAKVICLKDDYEDDMEENDDD